MGLSLAMLTRCLLVFCLLSRVLPNLRRAEQDGLGEELGEVVIEQRHRPSVHKSYGSGQYVIPAAALLPQHQHDLSDDPAGGEEPGEYFEEVYDNGEDEALEAKSDKDFNVEDMEVNLAESFLTISPAAQYEHMDKLAGFEDIPGQDNFEDIPGQGNFENIPSQDSFENIPGQGSFENIPRQGNLVLDPEKKTSKDETVGQSSRTALSKLLRLLVAAYI